MGERLLFLGFGANIWIDYNVQDIPRLERHDTTRLE